MIEYVLCYAQSFTYGAMFGGAIVWLLLTRKKEVDDR
jgi:hypothetical protein